MKTLAALLLLLLAIPATPAETKEGAWRLAEPGWHYEFPRDHGQHNDFKTEWWYFTGNLRAADGREFGFEVTWFRQGINPQPPAGVSRFVVADFKFAHFAISDIAAQRFDFLQKISRGAYGEAGCGMGDRLAWIDDWKLTTLPGGTWHIEAEHEGRAIELDLTPEKPPVIEGENGVSLKSAGEGHASCYYSFTRMRSVGRVTLPGAAPVSVSGETWFDHEWATNQLAPDQAGWDWFSVQLSNGAELMLYRMRLKNGQIDPASSGTYTDQQGKVTYLKAADLNLSPQDWWHSPTTKADYPIRWQVDIQRLGLSLEISTPLKNQELSLPGIVYWEGLIHCTGRQSGAALTGHGYLELTGYAASLN